MATRAAPFLIEWRKPSTRTPSGWTKWQPYVVAWSEQEATDLIAVNESLWREGEYEWRCVPRGGGSGE